MNKKITPCIYIIINTKNKKFYIGQTVNFRQRRNLHVSQLNRNIHDNQHLQNAWNKHGSKYFVFKVLEYCDIDYLDEREQYYIDMHINKGMCYNISKSVISPMRGISHSIETRLKISKANTGKKHSQETIEKMRIACRHIPSEETKRKISESHKGKKRPPVTEETRKKLRESHIGEIHSDERRKKMSEAAKKRPPRTKEHQEKINEALRKHFKNKGDNSDDTQN